MVMVVSLLHDELLISEIDGEGTNSNSETGEGVFKTVKTGELSLVSPSVSLSPGVSTHVVL